MLKTSFHAAAQEIDFSQRAAAAEVRRAKLDSSSHSNQGDQRMGGKEDKRQNEGPDKARQLDSVFVLTNAIYFKAKWKYEFKKSNTRSKMFHTDNKIQGMQSKKVQMMDLTETLEFADLHNAAPSI